MKNVDSILTPISDFSETIDDVFNIVVLSEEYHLMSTSQRHQVVDLFYHIKQCLN